MDLTRPEPHRTDWPGTYALLGASLETSDYSQRKVLTNWLFVFRSLVARISARFFVAR